MSGYWLGVITPIIAALVIAAVALLVRGVLRVVEFTVVHYASEDETRRALLGAVTYSARRVWMIGSGNLGIAIFAGQHLEERREAYGRLHNPPTVSLSDIRATERPRRKDAE